MNVQIHRATSVARRIAFGGIATVLVVFMPVPYVFADSAGSTTPSASTSCSPVAPAPTGINQPTGADASTYTYNSCTGVWENSYYTWSPATQTATPKTPYVYTCDSSTWQWTTMKWSYVPSSNSFVQLKVTVPSLPAGAVIAAGSLAICAPPSTGTITDPGSNSTNITNSNTTNNTTVNSADTNSVANQLNSTAITGNATVQGNNTGGNATTGNAEVVANVCNSVQSNSTLCGGTTSAGVTTFVATINGNVQGNLIVDPSQLQPASGTAALSTTNNLTVNATNNNQIGNNINLNATSGDATVARNGTGGNATTGNAEAIANVVNMLNSVITSGKSFVGVININGNLNGNILLPQSFLDNLIASNAPSTTVNLSQTQANNLGITTTNNQSIANNVSSNATTGSATVANNGTGGSSTTGNAYTKVTVFNLTGTQVVSANSLLVFVNVSGQWVGVIMNAPAGATAAALGGGVTQNTTNNAKIATTTNDSITNNINVAAASGNAAVTGNNTGGNARSGNADTAVNLLNLDGAQFNVSGWFGILFINIMGNWFGSVKAYTPPSTDTNTPAPSSSAPAHNDSSVHVFQFIPQPDTSGVTNAATSNELSTTVGAQLASKAGQVLGTGLANASQNAKALAVDPNSKGAQQFQAIGGILVGVGLSTMAIERIMSIRRSRKSLI